MKILKQTAIILCLITCTGCSSALMLGAGGVVGYLVHDKVDKGELKLPSFDCHNEDVK